MNVLLTGASGFIGRHLLSALLDDGHRVTVVRHRAAPHADPRVQVIVGDFTRDTTAAAWLPRLDGIDIVINAVGIIRQHGAQSFAALHTDAPRALFEACAQKHVRRIVQISALGADEEAVSAYHLSKKAADDYLLKHSLPAVILQPSVVFGAGGASTALFLTLASMPVLVRFGDGLQMVQPVHIDDVVNAVRAAIVSPSALPNRIALAGPEPMPLAQYLVALRRAMGMRFAPVIPIPLALARLSARVAGWFGASPLDPETFAMLERGSMADAGPATVLLGRPPRAIATFIAPPEQAVIRTRALLGWLLPMLRIAIALVWIVTGIVSLGIYPVSESYALLARVGVPATMAPLMLYGAALLDLAIGIAILLLPRRRWLWIGQVLLIVFYSLAIAWRLPEFLIHPYGPLVKNLPMLAAIWLLLELEED